ncbi:flagellar basal-body MS-ring/collar protein FliF [Thiorhodovibrio frisius]|uniref:Flagellar M-ring protein n=1 Tax=Thiorhodovibrio frisius TaxID=631362 RepID=H8YZ33_9GAMM|nr:flagellar basal-body MS-ring/collar protein FliF [Thiorhodovibrio frisius]EIC21960.1 flagellar basal-body M-ring protein/flagellar hook-basal body protein FliF [Thiorhodovibrio frisius]WPL24249.1 Flagellar M-ring protein [Thiorhodovibrio frisius]
MAAALTERLSTGLRNFTALSAGRQLALLGVVAGGMVVVAGVLFWALRPTYVPLFDGRMDNAEAAQVMEALGQMGVPYKVSNRMGQSGQIEIPEKRIAETRLLLAGQGLPKSADIGFELLQEDSGFGASRLMESARHQRALEGELGRSIAALDPVELARVHLAQPERSVFIRERKPPTASVVVHLRSGRGLSDAQVAAIVHLVSSSVPALEPDAVTVVDQTGRLLTNNDDEMGLYANADQLDYTRKLEDTYAQRVRSLLLPILGPEGMRVQVAADLDFSRVERTEELFDPDRTALRSEQVSEQERVGSDLGPMGVPGALTNQPPAGGQLGADAAAAGAETEAPKSRSLDSIRNYEVDRTIAHVREMPGAIKRMSTAVVVDYIEQTSEEGEVTRIPRPAEELESIRALVREAVGFNEARGDSINVISAAFTTEQEMEPAQVWTQPWFADLAKLGAGVLLAILVLLTVVRPGVKQLLGGPGKDMVADGDDEDEDEDGEGEDHVSLSQQSSAVAALTGPKGPDQQQLDLDAVREMVEEDPKRVAQVMKAWLGVNDGG